MVPTKSKAARPPYTGVQQCMQRSGRSTDALQLRPGTAAALQRGKDAAHLVRSARAPLAGFAAPTAAARWLPPG